jgi:hypothetical protein
LAVSVQTSAPWAHDESGTFPTILDFDVKRAVAFWGGAPDSLRGWELILSDENPCDGCMGLTEHYRSTMWAHVYPHCYPGSFSTIAHEIGHAIIGDGDHRDPRWKAIDSGELNPTGECVP